MNNNAAMHEKCCTNNCAARAHIYKKGLSRTTSVSEFTSTVLLFAEIHSHRFRSVHPADKNRSATPTLYPSQTRSISFSAHMAVPCSIFGLFAKNSKSFHSTFRFLSGIGSTRRSTPSTRRRKTCRFDRNACRASASRSICSQTQPSRRFLP